MYFCGIDAGSITTKAVLIDEFCNIKAWSVVKTKASIKQASENVIAEILKYDNLTLKDMDFIVSTGYGRKKVAFTHKFITEITAHARGIGFIFPNTKIIIDIGGQDTKIIELDSHGAVVDFVMNDKCAAGTGRFLEVMAGILGIKLNDFGKVALSSKNKLKLASTCTVFAESEVISLISDETPLNDIAYAIHSSVVGNIISLAKKLHLDGIITLSGGVSFNIAIREMLQKKLGTTVNVADNPQIMGALGAAIVAKYNYGEKF